MSSVIEALHIYDERNPILSHVYTGRPLTSAHVLSLFLEHPAPRPNLVYLPNANPPTLVFSLVHADLLLLATTSAEIEPLLVLEFLHRVVDAFEEFIGLPPLAYKLEQNYDVAAQLLTEMCDAGMVNTTEPNALRDLVEVEGWMGKLLGSITLPGKPGFGGPSAPSLLAQSNTPALPWRRANVRHTSNELYADVVETLSVTLAPSGRPLSALAHGTIAFTSKVSGVPDMTVHLTGPSGKYNLASLLELPVFHPCVRLSRWREQPGELSFVPPDGRFILAGYEVDLLPVLSNGKSGPSLSASNNNSTLRLPVSLDIKTGLGPAGADFEVRLHLNRAFSAGAGSSTFSFGQHARSAGVGGLGVGSRGGAGASAAAGTQANPLLDDLSVTVPLPAGVRNLSELRPTKGDAAYSPGDRALEWRIANADLASAAFIGLRCTVVGLPGGGGGDNEDDPAEDPEAAGMGLSGFAAYDEEQPYQAAGPETALNQDKAGKGGANGRSGGGEKPGEGDGAEADHAQQQQQQYKALMPSSAAVSFAVKGWLPSGIRVESIAMDPRKSRGLGETVKPYKGVKYLTVSKRGVEIRC